MNKVLLIVSGFFLYSLTSCYPLGGYTGSSYKLMSTDKVYFDISQNTLHLAVHFTEKLRIRILKVPVEGESAVVLDESFKVKEINNAYHPFSDSVFSSIKKKKVTIEIDLDDKKEKMYSIFILPEYWGQEKIVYALVRVYDK